MAACLVWPPQWTPTPSSALTHALFLKSYFFHLHKQLLNCHLIPPPFFPPLLLNSALGMKGWHVILSTSYGARLALCEHDKEWPLVTTFNFAHWVTRSDKHSSLSTCRKKITSASSLNPGRLPTSQTEFWQCRLSPMDLACKASCPASDSEAHPYEGLAERSARCTVTRWHEISVGSWKGSARGKTCWWSPSIFPFRSEASVVVQAATDIIGLFSSLWKPLPKQPSHPSKPGKVKPFKQTKSQRHLTEAGVTQ